MKLKTGKDVDVVGEVMINNKHYGIVKLPNAKYVAENVPVISFILIPIYEFERDIPFDVCF